MAIWLIFALCLPRDNFHRMWRIVLTTSWTRENMLESWTRAVFVFICTRNGTINAMHSIQKINSCSPTVLGPLLKQLLENYKCHACECNLRQFFSPFKSLWLSESELHE
jgi:hypothetical protein